MGLALDLSALVCWQGYQPGTNFIGCKLVTQLTWMHPYIHKKQVFIAFTGPNLGLLANSMVDRQHIDEGHAIYESALSQNALGNV